MEFGERQTSPLKAIKQHCFECSNGQTSEVSNCPVTDCALWEFRKGKNPYAKHTNRTFTEEERQNFIERMQNARNKVDE